MTPTRHPAVFLDKDGTLVEDVPYNVDPARVTLAAGARESACALHDAGYRLVVVTNQSGVARGLFERGALRGVEDRLAELLGVPLAGFYDCPHHPDGSVAEYAIDCGCRKPLPGLLTDAAADLDLDLSRSWMVGDILNDVEAGQRAGCRTVLIDNGNETEWVEGLLRVPDHRCGDLLEVARLILSASPPINSARLAA